VLCVCEQVSECVCMRVCCNKNAFSLVVTRFKVPEDFQSILQSQTHGPTTQLIASDYYAKRSFDPKVQVQYHVPSGTTPRKVEIER